MLSTWVLCCSLVSETSLWWQSKKAACHCKTINDLENFLNHESFSGCCCHRPVPGKRGHSQTWCHFWPEDVNLVCWRWLIHLWTVLLVCGCEHFSYENCPTLTQIVSEMIKEQFHHGGSFKNQCLRQCPMNFKNQGVQPGLLLSQRCTTEVVWSPLARCVKSHWCCQVWLHICHWVQLQGCCWMCWDILRVQPRGLVTGLSLGMLLGVTVLLPLLLEKLEVQSHVLLLGHSAPWWPPVIRRCAVHCNVPKNEGCPMDMSQSLVACSWRGVECPNCKSFLAQNVASKQKCLPLLTCEWANWGIAQEDPPKCSQSIQGIAWPRGVRGDDGQDGEERGHQAQMWQAAPHLFASSWLTQLWNDLKIFEEGGHDSCCEDEAREEARGAACEGCMPQQTCGQDHQCQGWLQCHTFSCKSDWKLLLWLFRLMAHSSLWSPWEKSCCDSVLPSREGAASLCHILPTPWRPFISSQQLCLTSHIEVQHESRPSCWFGVEFLRKAERKARVSASFVSQCWAWCTSLLLLKAGWLWQMWLSMCNRSWENVKNAKTPSKGQTDITHTIWGVEKWKFCDEEECVIKCLEDCRLCQISILFMTWSPVQ